MAELIEPNNILSGGIEYSGDTRISDYQNFISYAELYAFRYNSIDAVVNQEGLKIINDGNESKIVNFLGFNKRLNAFTQAYTDDITGVENRYSFDEGFGIKTIDVNINTKYVPTVTIVFRDVRGSSFFNSKTLDGNSEANLRSSYGILYDFPPPTFVLVLKGVYGKPTRYFLHLVKTNANFNSETGDYEITAEFIGKTFAVLSDIKIGYLKAMSYFKEPNKIATPNATQGVDSFFELLLKGKVFYNDINQLLEEVQTNDLNSINNDISLINEFLTSVNNINYENTIRNFERGRGVIDGRIITKPLGVNTYITSENDTQELTERYYISFDIDSSNTQLASDLEAYLNSQKNNLLNVRYRELVGDSFESDDILIDIREKTFSQTNFVTKNFNESTYVFYFDYTKFYNKLIEIREVKKLSKFDLQKEISDDINKLLKNNLGFSPTVGNIFKIICDEIDNFLVELREAGRINSIGSSNIQNSQITIVDQVAFPTVFKERTDENGVIRQEKVYPASKEILEEFPEFASFGEVQFVEKFINAYFKVQQREEFERQKEKLERERFSYIPTTTIGVDPLQRGVSQYSDTDSNVSFLSKILEQYFIHTQYSYKGILNEESIIDFISLDNIPERILTYLSRTDAINIANSFFSEKTLRIIDGVITEYNEYIQQNPTSNIIDYLSDPNGKYYSSQEIQSIINLPPTQEFVYRETPIYSNRLNDNFKGLELLDEAPEIVNVEFNSDDKSINYLKKVINGNLLNKFLFLTSGEKFAFLTRNNILLFKDILFENTKNEKSLNQIESDFLNFNDLSDYISFNERFYNSLIVYNGNRNTQGINFVISNITLDVKSFTDSSVENKFLFPSIIQVPRIFCVKIGYQILNDQNNNYEYLSDLDKELFLNIYNDFATTETIDQLYNLFSPFFNNGQIDLSNFTNIDQFNELLFEPIYIKNNTSLSFVPQNDDQNNELSFFNFQGLNTETSITLKENARINFYIKNLFTALKSEIKNKIEKTKDRKKDFNSRIQDNDLKTQLYYQFKKIYDRWIIGTGNQNTESFCFPYSNNKPLIDLFKFVDRGYNDIGFNGGAQTNNAAVIDFQNLISYAEDSDTEIYGAMSNLLSENNFEFFPLPNFVDYSTNQTAFNDMFSLQSQTDIDLQPSFLCMYVGGYSTTLNYGENAYEKDDGVYFDKTDKSQTPSDLKGDLVKVFSIAVGKQNQTIFGDIQFNSDEFRETGESLKLMDNIFNKFDTNLPTPKGMNLFEVYENRSYGTKIEVPLGCTQIQPCMYYQIKNLPMINGAYIILNVQHSIDAETQQLKTLFEGTRISKFIKPIVNNPITSVLGISNELGRIAQENSGESPTLSPSVNYIKTQPNQSIVRFNGQSFIPNTTRFNVTNPNDNTINTNNVDITEFEN